MCRIEGGLTYFRFSNVQKCRRYLIGLNPRANPSGLVNEIENNKDADP